MSFLFYLLLPSARYVDIEFYPTKGWKSSWLLLWISTLRAFWISPIVTVVHSEHGLSINVNPNGQCAVVSFQFISTLFLLSSIQFYNSSDKDVFNVQFILFAPIIVEDKNDWGSKYLRFFINRQIEDRVACWGSLDVAQARGDPLCVTLWSTPCSLIPLTPFLSCTFATG